MNSPDTLLDDLLKANDITERQDIVVFRKFLIMIIAFQSETGISDTKMKKFHLILSDFIELCNDEKNKKK